jgi:hypothetical protein
MTREIEILAEAAQEAAEAARWYERERPGLGAEFQAAIEVAMDLLEESPVPSVPATGSAANRGVRRLILRRFPFDLIFVHSRSLVRVIAFAHHSRRPDYWRRRLRT